MSGSSYRALTGNSALPTRTYSDSSSVTAIKDKFSSMARDKAVLADKRMRVASSGFGQKPTLKTGNANRFGAPIVRSPIKEQSVTVFGVCNVPAMETETPVDIMVSVVTRGTSPTPPAHSTFLRSKHAGQQEFSMLMVPRKHGKGVDVNVQTDEKFLRSMPSLKTASSIPVPRYQIGIRSGYNNYSKSKDSGSTSDNSGMLQCICFIKYNPNSFDFNIGHDQDSYLSDSSNHSKSRSNSSETSKLPQPNWTRSRTLEKNREELAISRSPSVSSTAEEKPPTGRKAEEPKLVTIRSVAPVVGVAIISEASKLQYPMIRRIDSTDQSRWLQGFERRYDNQDDPPLLDDVSRDFDVNMNNTLKIPAYSVRKMDSSDRNRWLREAEHDNDNEGPLSCITGSTCSESTKSNSTSSNDYRYGIRKMDSSDRTRWLLEAAQEDAGVKRLEYCGGIPNFESIERPSLSPTCDAHKTTLAGTNQQHRRDSDEQTLNIQNSMLSCNDECVGNRDYHASGDPLSGTNRTYGIRKMDSFDTPWWLLNDETDRCASDDSKSGTDKIGSRSPEALMSYGVRKMDSTDSPWWLSGDECNRVNDSLVKNAHVLRSPDMWSLGKPENDSSRTGLCENRQRIWPENGVESRPESGTRLSDEDSSSGEDDENYLDSKRPEEPWNVYKYRSAAVATEEDKWPDSLASNWRQPDGQNTDACSTSVSIDWSRDDGPDRSKTTPVASPLERAGKTESYDSSWLPTTDDGSAGSRSREPGQTSTAGNAVAICSADDGGSSTDWWAETNRTDRFVTAKRTIKNVEIVVAERPANKIPTKELNLQDELDQLMLFIGGCRNIDELLGNEEPPPAAPTTPPDTTDSGNRIICFFAELYHA